MREKVQNTRPVAHGMSLNSPGGSTLQSGRGLSTVSSAFRCFYLYLQWPSVFYHMLTRLMKVNDTCYKACNSAAFTTCDSWSDRWLASAACCVYANTLAKICKQVVRGTAYLVPRRTAGCCQEFVWTKIDLISQDIYISLGCMKLQLLLHCLFT